MITLFDAILKINPSIVTLRGEEAFDINGNPVEYDMAQAQAKLAELQAEETAKEQAQAQAKASALAKLTALGLTLDEVKALIG
jgi:hypothetical protein